MDFSFTKEQLAFREELVAFLDKELPPGWLGLVDNGDRFREENWEIDREMARKFARKGWLAISWPREYGGQGRSPIETMIFREEVEYRGSPGVDFWGIDMVAPTLLQYGSEEQKKRFLPPIARGEVTWCQGFS